MSYYQVGHIPSVDICFPTEERDEVTRDTYIFKSVISKCLQVQDDKTVVDESERLSFSLQDEIKKHREYQDFSHAHIEHEQQQQYVQVGTLEEVETFQNFFVRDLFREQKEVNFNAPFQPGREIDKKYYFVPLRLCKDESDCVDNLLYKIDRDLMRYIVQIKDKGYKTLQKHICEEMRERLGPEATLEEREAYLETFMLVKEDKPHRIYNYFDIFENLKDMPAEEFASAIKGKFDNMESKCAFDLLFKD